ncbi:MAG TPA: DUF3606 domain-containing protein [Caldimonas sp.]|nr:DUF3606 domain-containing protein [Caldimonas sp.]
MASSRTPTDASDDPRLDVRDEADLQAWAGRLDASPEELRAAAAAVGDRIADIELYLKGSRASTNRERVERGLNGP